MATAALPAPATTRNFHDSIRSTFSQATTGSSPATSTTSLAYHLETSGNATVGLFKEQTSHNSLVVKLMTEQTKLLKKIAGSGGGLGGLLGSGLTLGTGLFGSNFIGRSVDRFIVAPIKGLFVGIGKAIYRYSGAEFVVNAIKGLKTKAVTGLKNMGEAMLEGLFRGTKTLFRAPLDLIKSAGRPIFRGVANAGKFVGEFLKPLANLAKLGSFSGLGKAALGVLKIGKVIPVVGEVIMAGLSVLDAFNGWKDADKILGKDKSLLTINDKVVSSYATLINGLSFGLADYLSQKAGYKNYAVVTEQAEKNVRDLGISIGNLSSALVVYSGAKITDAYKSIQSLLPSSDQLIADLKNLPTTVTQTYEDFKTYIWTSMSSIFGMMKDSFGDFFKGIGDKISTALGPQTKAVSRANVDKATNTVQKKQDPRYNKKVDPTTTGAISGAGPTGANNSILASYGLGGGSATSTGNPGLNSADWGATSGSNIPSVAEVASESGGYSPSPARQSATAGGVPSTSGATTNPATVASGNPGSLGGKGASENAKYVYQMATTSRDKGGLGLTGQQAIGMIAGLQGESGKGLATYDPKTANGASYDINGPSAGMAQWHDVDGKPGGRFTALKNFASANKMDWKDKETQFKFLKHELETSEGGAYKALTKSQTAEEAVSAWVTKFERPKYPDSEIAKRSLNIKSLHGIGDQTVSVPTPQVAANGTSVTPANPATANTTNDTNDTSSTATPTSVNNSNVQNKVVNTATPALSNSVSAISNITGGDNYQSIVNGPSSLGQAMGLGKSTATPTSAQMDASQSVQRSLVQAPVDATKLSNSAAVPVMDNALQQTAIPAQAVPPAAATDQGGGVPRSGNNASAGGNGVGQRSFTVADVPSSDEWKMLLVNGSVMT